MLNDARRMAQGGTRIRRVRCSTGCSRCWRTCRPASPQMGREGNPGAADDERPRLHDAAPAGAARAELPGAARPNPAINRPATRPGPGSRRRQAPPWARPVARRREQLRQGGALMRQFGNLMGDLPQGMGQRVIPCATRCFTSTGLQRRRRYPEPGALTHMQQSLQSMQQMLQRQTGSSLGRGQDHQMDSGAVHRRTATGRGHR